MNDERSSLPHYHLLGVRVHAMTIADMHGLIEAAVQRRERLLIVSQNLHSVYLYHRDEKLRQLHALATHVRIDGMPLIFFGRWLGYPLEKEHRTGWMDWLDPFMREAQQRRWRLFYLGSKPGVAEEGARRLRQRYPGLDLATHHGYFTMEGEENERVLELIRQHAPDVLIVGMGMPRQERWLLANHDKLAAPVLLTSGAAIDYVAGEIPTPPRWLGPLGLEWLYRLASEPRRLWRRYLLEPWFAGALFVRDLWRLRRGA